MTETARGMAQRAIVQTSPDLSTWTTRQDLEFYEGSEGQNEILGHAKFRLVWGSAIVRALEETAQEIPEQDLSGLFVRIGRENFGGGGSITYGDTTFDPVWWGKMLSPGTRTTGRSGVTEYTAAGIATVFNERQCWQGRALSKTSPLTYSIAFDLAPFNAYPSGDRSTATGSVGGVNIYLHDATKTDTGNQWTARQILDYLLACNFRYEQPPTPSGSGQAGLNWAISDPQNNLAWIPGRFEAKGRTLMGAINDLCGKHRGLTWWVTVSGTTLTINVASGLTANLTIGTTTIYANPAIWDQTDGLDPFIHPSIVRTINDEVADEIVVKGSPRTIGITLAIYGSGTPFVANAAAQLDKGWTSAAETACDNYLDNFNAASRRTSYQHAYRRFILKAEGWNGDQYGSSGMPLAMDPVTSYEYGTAGYDGTVATGAGGGPKPAGWYKCAGDLPCAVGFTALNVGPRQPAVVVAEDYAAGTFQDHTSDWSVSFETSPPAVIIDDRADGAIIRAILRAGRKILVSLSLVDFYPFQVLWRRDPATWPGITPRTKTIEKAELSQDFLLSGMVTGISAEGGGTATTQATQLTIRDNVVQLRALLAQARAWYEEPYQLVSFTDRGTWDADPSYRPGTILGVYTDGTTDRDINALVTRRTWKLEMATGEDGIKVPYWSTTFETDQIYPDMEAVL